MKVQKWSRQIHRYLSFFFAGMITIYAISGLVMNHRNSINPYNRVHLEEFTINNAASYTQANISKSAIIELLTPLSEAKNYTKHYFPKPHTVKIFLKGGSSVWINNTDGQVSYERLTPRPVLGNMTRLHYGHGWWWKIFADAFAISLILVVITGFTMIKPQQLAKAKILIPVALGILIPLLFVLLGR